MNWTGDFGITVIKGHMAFLRISHAVFIDLSTSYSLSDKFKEHIFVHIWHTCTITLVVVKTIDLRKNNYLGTVSWKRHWVGGKRSLNHWMKGYNLADISNFGKGGEWWAFHTSSHNNAKMLKIYYQSNNSNGDWCTMV